jgi:hypothetical protein
MVNGLVNKENVWYYSFYNNLIYYYHGKYYIEVYKGSKVTEVCRKNTFPHINDNDCIFLFFCFFEKYIIFTNEIS